MVLTQYDVQLENVLLLLHQGDAIYDFVKTVTNFS